MIYKWVNGAAFLLAVSVGPIGGAQASVLSAGCSPAGSGAGGSYSGITTCNTFNAINGTLTDITVHYFASISTSVHNGSGQSLVAKVSAQFDFAAFPFSSSTSQTGIMSSGNVLVGAGDTGVASTSAHFDRNLASLGIPHTFDYFTGAGGTFSVGEQVSRVFLTISALSPGNSTFESTGFADISIDYIYTAAAPPPVDPPPVDPPPVNPPPNTVPEPGSLALLALSLAALGATRRKKT